MNDRFEPAIRLVVDELVALIEVAVEPDVVDQQERVVVARRVGTAPIKQFRYKDAFRPPPARDRAASPKAGH